MKNVVTTDSINKVDKIVSSLYGAGYAIIESQENELDSCFKYLESLSSFSTEYLYWQTMQILLVIAVVVWQIVVLKTFFRRKKLIPE